MTFVLYYFSLSQAYSFLCCVVLSLCGCWALFSVLVLPLLPDRYGSGMRCLVPTLAVQLVQSQQPLVVGSPSAVTVCPAPALWRCRVLVAVCFTLLLLLFVELPWGLCCGILSPWPLVAPYPSVISSLGFFLWHLFRLGFGVLLLFFLGGGLPFPCPCCFSLAFTTVLLSR